MRRWLSVPIAALAGLCTAPQAGAAVFWEQTYTPDPSGVTSVDIFDDSGMASVGVVYGEAGLYEAGLQVIGGQFQDVAWFFSGSVDYYDKCCGWEDAFIYGYAQGDLCEMNLGVGESHVGTSLAVIRYWPYASLPSWMGDARIGGQIYPWSAVVDGTQPFTVEFLSIPEEPTW